MKEREANHQYHSRFTKLVFFSLALPCRKYIFGSCFAFFWYTFHEVPISTDHQESRLAMLAGNFSVWSTVSSLMVRCRATRRLEAQDRYQEKVSKDEEQNQVKKTHKTLASSDWTFQSVSWPLHWPAQRPRTFWCGFFIALLVMFLSVHDPNCFWSLACWRRRWCFQHVAGLWRVVFLFFSPKKYIYLYTF